ncbi:MAG: hypothetical protein JWM31_2395 [Solirubrobacterales bacterium]|nr:hypothetical protein [Solirubrobacterales bacterium]
MTSLTSRTDLLEHVDDEQPAATAARTGLLRFARMTGSSIAGRDAGPWVRTS